MGISVLSCVSLLLVFELFSSSVGVLQSVPGSTLVFPCLPGQNQKSFAGAKITWKYNDYLVPDYPESSKELKASKDGFYLEISPVSVANEGEYECVIKQNDMEWQKVHIVQVDVSSSYILKVIEGSTVNLPCDRPPSSKDPVHWYRYDKGMTNGKRKQLNPAETGEMVEGDRLEWLYGPLEKDMTITLNEVKMEDAGMYYCETAEQGRDSSNFNTIELIVEAAPTVLPYSCVGFMTPWESRQDETSRPWEAMLGESLNEFSMKLYAHLSQSQPMKNLLFSPISISGVLTHLLLGARGKTRRDMETALCLSHDFFCVHSEMKKLKLKLQDTLKMASQIYYNPNMKLSESFTNQSMQFYDADPVKLTNTSEVNVEMINSWVAKQTNNKIKELVDSVPAHTELLLLNTVYFNGQWKMKFDAKSKTFPFVKLNGDTVKVPVLYSAKYKLAVQYVPAVKAQVAMFPLSGASSLFILLPPTTKLTDLQLVEGKMTDRAVSQMVEQMNQVSPQATEVTLPKIKLDIRTEMNTLLRKIGLSELFDSANLCGLYPDNELLLTEARHRAFLSLTEEGVEAGAATSLSFSRSFSSFSALRPFLMILWSDQAKVPLFVGRVTEP
ncbi:plasma protease C1 inhibitor precursor [Oncorhynchus mykiss]|uniref:C1 inhibitor n=1 Tax=Oncorhynchus mykiss TaxID=8022 RepID=Q70W32_ONCMY|nr:plasma protease C1 inhibitor precursor [Oncorhynchus mykiss]CAD58653.1 C1 inhibitor [Oncorhynchus mykiss]